MSLHQAKAEFSGLERWVCTDVYLHHFNMIGNRYNLYIDSEHFIINSDSVSSNETTKHRHNLKKDIGTYNIFQEVKKNLLFCTFLEERTFFYFKKIFKKTTSMIFTDKNSDFEL